jgi:hypothetical protein
LFDDDHLNKSLEHCAGQVRTRRQQQAHWYAYHALNALLVPGKLEWVRGVERIISDDNTVFLVGVLEQLGRWRYESGMSPEELIDCARCYSEHLANGMSARTVELSIRKTRRWEREACIEDTPAEMDAAGQADVAVKTVK